MRCLALLSLIAIVQAPAIAGEWSGEVGLELRYFQHDALDSRQTNTSNVSIYVEPEFYHDWDEKNLRFVATPFLRWDQSDSERSHVDFRELYLQWSLNDFEISLGAKKYFWGVTESAHIVDIINQDDAIENIDGEDKLGQPMLSVRWLSDFGDIDFFVMPYFRERTFAGPEGRLRPLITVEQDLARFESGAEERHIDWALRWQNYLGDWDLGLSHFSGTSRDPLLELVLSLDGPRLIPLYLQIEQTSIDAQITNGDWLGKLELATTDRRDGRYTSLAAGFEFTFNNVFGSVVNIGLLSEYLFDDRSAQETGFNNDLAIGTRIAFNDLQSSEILAFSGIDLDTQSRFSSLEANRRLGQNYKIGLEARVFSDIEPEELLYSLRDDDYIELALSWYF